MFLHIDVVEFYDPSIPFVSVCLNHTSIMQIEPISNRIRKLFEERQQKAIDIDSSRLKVELPTKGALVTLYNGASLYTVTPYKDMVDALSKTNMLILTPAEVS